MEETGTVAKRKKTAGKNKQSKNRQKNRADVSRPGSDSVQAKKEPIKKEPIKKEPIKKELVEDRAKKEPTKKNADSKKTRRGLWDNAWVKYQRKRFVTKFGSLKNRLAGGKWDRRTILSAVSALVVLIAVCGLLLL